MGDDEQSGPRILVVDNLLSRREALRERLAEEGFRVEASEGGGGAALWLAQTFRPWVIIVTHDLPNTDGLEVLELLKADSEIAHFPVILTAPTLDNEVHEKEALAVAGLEAGAAHVLVNQPSPGLLLAHVYAQLNVFQMQMELREKNEYLRGLVVRDPMTGLFNHAHLHEALEREIARSSRYGSPLSLMFIDLDEFKTVNDDHGHQAGDFCLKTTSGILTEGSRRSDVIARYGGDEFAIILPDTPKAGAASRGEFLRKKVAGREFLEIGLPSQSISVGVAGFPEDAHDRTSLIRAADRALYASKRLGRNRVVAYTQELSADDDETAAEPLAQAVALSATISDGEVDFVYQPIVDRRGNIFAYEALCRPRHEAFPDPGVLFATAERTGRVPDLGRACRTVAIAPLAELRLAQRLFLNLHPLELNSQLVEEAEATLANEASRIVFEITESAQIHDYERLRGLLHLLQRKGFKIALDDLGAGYAGLNSLALLKPDYVKLDMVLVRSASTDASVSRLLQHMVDFAHGEGMKVVAEGVETIIERDLVLELGCDLIQGYLFARPAPAFCGVDPNAIP